MLDPVSKPNDRPPDSHGEMRTPKAGIAVQHQSMATGLARAFAATAFFSLLGFLLAAWFTVYLPYRDSRVATGFHDAFEKVSQPLNETFARVKLLVRIRQEWGQSGVIDLDRPLELVRLYLPYLQDNTGLSAFAFAAADGQEVLIYRDRDGAVHSRQTDPERHPGTARYHLWGRAGEILGEETRPITYDARTRPWFSGAQSEQYRDSIFWSAPFTFVSTGRPGISAVVRWRDRHGREMTSDSGIDLSDLSGVTRTLTVGKDGIAALLTEDDRVIGLPRDPRFATDAQVDAALLKPLAELDLPTIAQGYAAWQSMGSSSGRPVKFSWQGSDWLGSVQPLDLGGRTFRFVAVAPANDFPVLSAASIGLLALLGLVAVIGGWLASLPVARAFALPLAKLVQDSERIGHLELAQPVTPTSAWREMVELAEAQETMRLRLMAATQHLESTVVTRTVELTRARDAANQASQSKARFLANMSHEIRTPLNAVLGFAQIGQLTAATPRMKELFDHIDRAGEHLLQLLNDILDFSRIDAGAIKLEWRPFNVRGLLERLRAQMEPAAQVKGLPLHLEIAPDTPVTIVGDETRISQILINLLSNGIKFTEQGEVRLSVKVADSILDFTVADTGIGISASEAARLFRPFEQANEGITRRFGGTGLGLAICQQLAQAMGGSVTLVRSVPGQGSEFRLVLPAQPDAAAAPPAEPAPQMPAR